VRALDGMDGIDGDQGSRVIKVGNTGSVSGLENRPNRVKSFGQRLITNWMSILFRAGLYEGRDVPAQ